ncbi:hypothetical protein SprV_0100116300 [Sparganum proliferum]
MRQRSIQLSASQTALGHQQILSISLPEENVVQQLSAPRSQVHSDRLFPHCKAGKGNGLEKAMYCAGSQREKTVFVAAADSVGAQHSPPGSVACLDTVIKATKDNQLARVLNNLQEGAQLFVESVLRLVGAGQWREEGSVDTEDCGEFGFSKKQEQAHGAVVDALRQTGQSSHDVVPNGKDDTDVTSTCRSVEGRSRRCGQHPPLSVDLVRRSGYH